MQPRTNNVGNALLQGTYRTVVLCHFINVLGALTHQIEFGYPNFTTSSVRAMMKTVQKTPVFLQNRKCSKCAEIYPLTAQYFQPNGWNETRTLQYFRPECKDCRSQDTRGRNQAKKLAGNPKSPVLGSPCELCGRTNQQLLFDHCHSTLKHRGWLCNSCNKGIGLLGDTTKALERVVLYLKQGECS